jgi:predicted aspartyl protease
MKRWSLLWGLGWLMLGLGLLPSGVAAGAAPSSSSTASTPNADAPGSIQRVETAMEKGDMVELYRLYQNRDDAVTHVLAAMALERLNLNLDNASRDASQCEKVLFDTQPGVAYYCALFESGDLRLSGKEKQADQMEISIAQRYKSKISATTLMKLVENAIRRAAQPEFQAQRPDHSITLPLARMFNGTSLYLDAQTNGKSMPLIVDTGASWLVLDERTASKWDVHYLDNTQGYIQGYFSKSVPTREGWIDKLQIGSITMENVPVYVIPHAPKMIGIDLLRRLGALLITKDSLTIFAANDAKPTCNDPLIASSHIGGNYLRMLTNIAINGHVQPAMLDTGSSTYLSGNAAVLSQYKSGLTGHILMSDISSQTHETGAKLATETVVIGHQPIKMTFIVFTDDTLPWGYVLGNLALDDMDFFFDFDNRHTCVLLHNHLHEFN